jgi:hypothetical protein
VQSFNQSSTTGGGLLCVLQSAGNNPATDPFADSTGGFADASGAVDTSMVGLASLAAPGSYSVKCQEDVGAVTLQTFVNLTAVQGSTATGNDVGHARRSRPSGHAQLQALDRTNQVAAGR